MSGGPAMSHLRRVGAFGGVVALIAVIATASVWGEPGKDTDLRDVRRSTDNKTPEKAADRRFSEDLAQSIFAKQQFIAYQTGKGENLFGMQLRPALPVAEPRPRDVVVIVSPSASMAQGPLVVARKV